MSNAHPDRSELSAIELLDGIKSELEAKVWTGTAPVAPCVELGRWLLAACSQIEAGKLRKYKLPNLYEGELSSPWIGRVLVGPGKANGLGTYDKAKSLGRFVSHAMGMDAFDLRKREFRKTRISLTRETENLANTGSTGIFDTLENKELIQVAIARVLATIKPELIIYQVVSHMQEYHAEYRVWPSYQWLSDRIAGNCLHICKLRKDAIRLVEDMIRKLLDNPWG